MRRFKALISQIDMTEGKPWKKILLFAVPMIIGNLFQQFYNIADAMILGQFIGDDALAAVSASMPLFFLIIVLLMGVSMGAGIMVSQYFGAKSREDLSYTVGNCIVMMAVLCVVLMAVGPFVSRPLLVLLQTPPDILDDSVLYMNILLYGVFGLAFFNILSGILRGLGDAFSPLLYIIITSILNAALNYLFIGVFGWGMPAVAAGTVLAQSFSAILCLLRLRKMRDSFDMGLKYLKPRKKYVNQVLKLGIPSGASQAIIAIAAMVVQPLVNDFGALFMATNVIVMRIDGLVMMPIFSFGNAMTVYAGQNMGAGKVDRVAKGTRQGALISAVTALVLVAIILIFGEYVARLFTDTESVISDSQVMLRILAPGFIVFSLAMVFWGSVRGAGDAISPMWASLVNTVIIRVPAAYLLVYLMGRPEALMYSLVAAWTMNMVLSVMIYRIGRWRKMGITGRPEHTIAGVEVVVDKDKRNIEIKDVSGDDLNKVWKILSKQYKGYTVTLNYSGPPGPAEALALEAVGAEVVEVVGDCVESAEEDAAEGVLYRAQVK